MYDLIKKFEYTSEPHFYEDSFYARNWVPRATGVIRRFEKDLNVSWESPEKDAFYIRCVGGLLVYTTKEGEVVCRNAAEPNILNYRKNLVVAFNNTNEETLTSCENNRKSGAFLFDLKKGEIIKRFSEKPIQSTAYRMKDLLVMRTRNEGNSGHSFQVRDLDFNLLWERDFSEICKYEDSLNGKEKPGEVANIYLYDENKIIVGCRNSKTFCFELNTGNLVWEGRMTGNIVIQGDLGYVSTGMSLFRLDLKTGARIGYGWENHRLPDLPEYNGYTIWPSGHGLTYHNGLLWYLVFSNGYSFVVAINPQDGHYEWIHCVDTVNKVMDIAFHQNRMFLHDSGGALHIYQKMDVLG